jgi:hypothetical protein
VNRSEFTPDWVLVTVQGASLKTRSGLEWDVPEKSSSSGLQPLANILGFVAPSIGPIAKAFLAFSPADNSKEESLPDPYISATFNEEVVSREIRSAPASNTTHPNWNYSFYAHLSGLREAGIDVAVLDDDGDDHAERVGSINLARRELAQVAATGRIVNRSTGNDELESLHVRIEPVPASVDTQFTSYELLLDEGMVATPLRVPEGAIITVRVHGEGRVGNGGFGCTPDVTPSGLANDECRNYNLTGYDLQQAPHGSAFALVGMTSEHNMQAVSLAEGHGEDECFEFTTSASGVLGFGVNDSDFRNNSGSFGFDVRVAPPGTKSSDCAGAESETARFYSHPIALSQSTARTRSSVPAKPP